VVERIRTIAGYGVSFALKHNLVSRENLALSIHDTAERDGLKLDLPERRAGHERVSMIVENSVLNTVFVQKCSRTGRGQSRTLFVDAVSRTCDR
jgi:hypothetical protein